MLLTMTTSMQSCICFTILLQVAGCTGGRSGVGSMYIYIHAGVFCMII